MIDIDEISSEIAVWAARNFPDESRITVTLGLAEEVGEVCRAVLKQDQGLRGTHAEWDAEIRKEVGDVFIKLVHVAEVCGFSVEQAIAWRWDEIRRRDWTVDKIGHGMPSAPQGGDA